MYIHTHTHLSFSDELECHLFCSLHLLAVGQYVGHHYLKGLLVIEQLLGGDLQGGQTLKVLLLLDTPLTQGVLHFIKFNNHIHYWFKTCYPVFKCTHGVRYLYAEICAIIFVVKLFEIDLCICTRCIDC